MQLFFSTTLLHIIFQHNNVKIPEKYLMSVVLPALKPVVIYQVILDAMKNVFLDARVQKMKFLMTTITAFL